jgi:hypothetical protein
MMYERPPRSLRSRLPLTRGRLRFILPLRVRGRTAEGGRGSLKHDFEFDAWLNRIKNPLPTADAVGYTLNCSRSDSNRKE